jgi:nucleoid DNA-binding protein
MDIDLLSKMVRETILDHDAVTLPGIGSFMAEIVPSMFTDKGYTIHPPYRRLFFSRREEGDTLLRDLYAESNDIPLASADRIVREFLAEMKEVLKEKKTVVFPGLGRLRATKENNFFFVADEDLDIYPAGFGLKPVSLKTHQETDEEVSEMVAGLAGILSEPIDTATATPAGASAVTTTAPAPAAVAPAASPASAPAAVAPAASPASAPVAVAPVAPASSAPDVPTAAQEAPSVEPVAPAPVPPASPAPATPAPETTAVPAAAAPEASTAPDGPVDPWAHLRKHEEPENWRAARAARRVARQEAKEKEREAKATVPAAATAPKRRSGWRRLLVALAILAAIALVLLVAYVVVARLAPDFVDRFLYSAEELEFIREAYE